MARFEVVVVRLLDRGWVSALVRPTVLGAMGYAAVFPIVQVALLAESADGGAGRAAWALVATVCFLPLHLRHVFYAARGERPPRGLWTLATMAVIISSTLPLAGPSWLPMFHALIVSSLIVLPFRYSVPISAVIVAVQAPLAIGLQSAQPAAASYYVLTATWRSASVFVPIWFIGAIAQLNTVRGRLAREAVVGERLKIDAELRATVGAALTAIADRGQLAMALIDDDPRSLPQALRVLVDSARAAGVEVRQLVSRYHGSSLQDELHVAVTLLAAAGIDTQLSLASDLPEVSDVAFRTDLRAMIARLLRDEEGGPYVLAVSRDGTGLRLELRRGPIRLIVPTVPSP